MSSCCLDMSSIRESDIALLEVDIPLFLYASADIMLIHSTEYFSIFPLEGIFEFLSVEQSLDLIGFLEFLPILILGLLCFFFDLLELIRSDLSCESLRYEHIPSLGARYSDDLPESTEVSNILEELYGECVCSHGTTIEKSLKNAKIREETKS